jgi:XTP/dITP diphosphohydrolase
MKIVLASSNQGKLKELQALLSPLDVELIPQSALNIEDAEETGLTFVENAIIKARHAAQLSGLPAIADDSGLAVAALGGAPGIYSARYAGSPTNAKNNIQKLLQAMENVPDKNREACFHTVLVFMLHAQDPTPLISDGIWQGSILRAPRGDNGFGYDPVFYVPAENKSSAELSPDVKNRLSHRGQALRNLILRLPDKIHESTLS